jgi:hypothetical protein
MAFFSILLTHILSHRGADDRFLSSAAWQTTKNDGLPY